MNWQPIETAPKDGREVIAYGIRLGEWGYTPDQPAWTGARYNAKEKRWYETKPRPNYCTGFKFTHWLCVVPGPPEAA